MKTLMLLALLTISTNSYSNELCLTIGDSQSAGPAHYNYGFTPKLQQMLNSFGFDVYTYAMPGSGASHWADINKKNGDYFYKDQTNTPYQRASMTSGNIKLPELSFNRSVNNPNYVQQIINYHQGNNGPRFNCFIMQIGDNDLSRVSSSVRYVAQIVKTLKEQHQAPDYCGIVTPTFKENHPRDQYKTITTQDKIDYTNALRQKFIEENLLEYCPILSTLDSQTRNRFEEISGNFTSDGLHINDQAGKIWAEQSLYLHPYL